MPSKGHCAKVNGTERLLLTISVQGVPRSLRSKAWRQKVGEKLCFSFSKSRLDRNIATLRTHNDDLRVLFSQTRTRAASGTRIQSKAHRNSRNDVWKYQTIRKASQQVYEALGKACNKHTEHMAHFRMEVEQFFSDGQNAPQVKFSMAFTHMTLAGSTSSIDPIWFQVESSLGDETRMPSSGMAPSLDELGKTLKRQFDGSGSQIPKKAKKCVRFEAPVQALVPSVTPMIASDAFTSKNCSKRDLCDDLRRCFREPRKANVCVGILENTEKCKHFVYPPPITPCSQPRKAVSLGQLIRSASRPGSVGSIPIHERLSLAKNLAIAVLQYHSTPWLRLSWRSEDILFFSNEEITNMQKVPNLSAPHLNATVKGPNEQLSQTSTTHQRTVARNQVLFSLGVVLLEIAHAASLESLKQDSDLTNGQEDRYTDFFTARRLAKTKNSVMGITYHNIVEQLVECVFPCGDDLNKDQLQAAFHSDIIYPLAELEEGFRKLHLAS